ncbi:hypothetical protein DOE76_09615 [Leifsonia sp. ku-ls]|nr:hypothetical protein DOE76_09615 [Leifsonia sp. ku-ls]
MTDVDDAGAKEPAREPRAVAPAGAHAAVNLIGVLGLFILPAGLTAVSLFLSLTGGLAATSGSREDIRDAVVGANSWMIAAAVLIFLSAAAIVTLRAVIHTRFLDATIWSFVAVLMCVVAYGLWRLAVYEIDHLAS